MRLINTFIFTLILSVFISCEKTVKDVPNVYKPKEIVDFTTEKSNLKLMPLKGQWYYKGKPFNGYAIVYTDDNIIIEKTGFFNGRREGKAYKYFNDGKIQRDMLYIENKLHGTAYNYFPNGKLSAESNYQLGVRDGEQKVWYKNGQLAKKRNLKNGKESGMQQAWLENGKIYVNYEAKNGRIFGMNRANLCYKLNKEKVTYAKGQ